MFNSFLAQGQEIFTQQDSAFFANQKADMKAWLVQVGIDSLKITDIRIQTVPSYVILRVYALSPEVWIALRESYLSQYKRNLEKDIFEKFVFLCEVEAKQALLIIEEPTESLSKFEVKAGLDPDKDYSFNIIEHNKPKVAHVEKFQLPAAKIIPPKEATSIDDFEVARLRIISILRQYYAKKGTWFEQSKFDVKESIDKQVKIIITNLRNEMLHDLFFGHFERIELRFYLTKEVEKVLFECMIDGKYGTSILLAPRSDYHYKDMGIRYQSYINDYALKIKSLLYYALK